MAYLVGGVGYFVLYTLFVAHEIGAGTIRTRAGADVPVGPETQVALRCLLTASTVGAIALGVRRWRPEPRAPWVLLAVAQGLYTVADAIFYTNLIVFHNSIFPSLADLFYIGRYPFAIAALALLFRQRAPGHNLSAVLDTTSIAVAVSLLYWLYVITPYERAASGQLAQLASVAFPVMDLGLLIVARLAALVAEQRRLATTDVLTGLRTRRFLQNQLPAAVSRADRSGQPFALLLVDVDNFKSINDRYGHPCGDTALAEIGSRLAAASRPGELLARFGGEEFALLGPTVGPETVGELAERLRRNVARDLIELDSGARLRATVSVGAAVYPVHAQDQTDLLIAADRNLYAAKAAGRNRVVIGCGAVIESRRTADDPAAPPPRHS
ncbi:GGDEF domain-containing protein [Parafrankia sp. FMc6]|uniref:GGDEF domain-containing protein n=1 Tax=Parafrankia soli TaxID=2599596 RepID=UPI0034D49FD5